MNLGEKGDFESKSAIKNVIIQIDDQKINGYTKNKKTVKCL